LAPTVVETTFAIIADIRRQGTTVLMVEQNAYLAPHGRSGLRAGDRPHRAAGAAADLMADDHVRQAYRAAVMLGGGCRS
jgi:branched-chain amino acid transport system ATP-binding protein